MGNYSIPLEGLNLQMDVKSKIFILSSLLFVTNISAEVKYYKNIFGHIHQNKTTASVSLTTISCGHPVRIIKRGNSKSPWIKVKTAGKEGFIFKKFLQNKRPKCFASKFPKFFNALDLDISEMYYWGRLYDQYIDGRTKVQ